MMKFGLNRFYIWPAKSYLCYDFEWRWAKMCLEIVFSPPYCPRFKVAWSDHIYFFGKFQPEVREGCWRGSPKHVTFASISRALIGRSSPVINSWLGSINLHLFRFFGHFVVCFRGEGFFLWAMASLKFVLFALFVVAGKVMCVLLTSLCFILIASRSLEEPRQQFNIRTKQYGTWLSRDFESPSYNNLYLRVASKKFHNVSRNWFRLWTKKTHVLYSIYSWVVLRAKKYKTTAVSSLLHSETEILYLW